MNKLPPFGKPLAALQAQGYHPNNSIYVYIGTHAWRKGQSFSQMYPTRTLILPPWLSPSEYTWPVNQCDILIVDTGYAEKDYIEELVCALYRFNASIIRCIGTARDFVVYKKD